MGRQPGWGAGENTVKREGGEGRGTGYSARLPRRWGAGGGGRTKSKGDVESTRRKGMGTGKLWQIKGDGWGMGGLVSLCVVIKRFMGVEGEGGSDSSHSRSSFCIL